MVVVGGEDIRVEGIAADTAADTKVSPSSPPFQAVFSVDESAYFPFLSHFHFPCSSPRFQKKTILLGFLVYY